MEITNNNQVDQFILDQIHLSPTEKIAFVFHPSFVYHFKVIKDFFYLFITFGILGLVFYLFFKEESYLIWMILGFTLVFLGVFFVVVKIHYTNIKKDAIVVTNQRIYKIDYNFKLHHTEKKPLDIEHNFVQSFVGKQIGFKQNIFSYGTIEINTLGEHDNIIMEYFPNPLKWQLILNKYSTKHKSEVPYSSIH